MSARRTSARCRARAPSAPPMATRRRSTSSHSNGDERSWNQSEWSRSSRIIPRRTLLSGHEPRLQPVADRGAAARARRPARASRSHAPSEPARRRRLADGHRARIPRDAARVLEGLVRLARAGGALQRVRTDGDRRRRPAHSLPARALAGTRRVAPPHLPRLARFGHGVPRRAGAALESTRARRRSR